MIIELPVVDKKKTQRAVEAALEKYRIFKYVLFEKRESRITTSAEPRYHTPTNTINDQTASIAIYNVDEQNQREEYCRLIELAVQELPDKQRDLIEKRYMSKNSDHITDYQVYCFELDPPISPTTYDKIRWKAMYKLALLLGIARFK